MVAIRKGSLIDGTNMQVLIPNYYKDCESTWGIPMYAVHREDLHTQLRLLATQKDGPGRPCNVQLRSKAVEYVSRRTWLPIDRPWLDVINMPALGRREWQSHNCNRRGSGGRSHCCRRWDSFESGEARHWRRVRPCWRYWLGVYAVAGAERRLSFGPRDRAHDSRLVHEILHGSWGYRRLGVVPLSKVRRVVPSWISDNMLTTWKFSNEVQNFLYLSRDFDTSHVGEGMDAPSY